MSGFERKILENGQPNPKYIDLCDEDQPIAGQKFACMSFISPEKILKKREVFLFDRVLAFLFHLLILKEYEFCPCLV